MQMQEAEPHSITHGRKPSDWCCCQHGHCSTLSDFEVQLNVPCSNASNTKRYLLHKHGKRGKGSSQGKQRSS